MKPRALLQTGPCVVIVAALLTTACTFSARTPEVYANVKAWYPSQEILIPFEVHGDGVRYAEYRYEYNAGDGWVVEIERTVRVPDKDHGLIELSATDPSWDHRLTFSALAQRGPGQPLEPVVTTEWYFHIDTTVPSAAIGILSLTLFEDNVETAGPMYDEWAWLELEIDHPEFDTPSGSPIRVHFTRDGSMPRDDEWSERMDPSQRETVWWGGDGPYDEEYRFIVVDEAGNRSGVRSVVFQSF